MTQAGFPQIWASVLGIFRTVAETRMLRTITGMFQTISGRSQSPQHDTKGHVKVSTAVFARVARIFARVARIFARVGTDLK